MTRTYLPKESYRIPILEALVESGGSAPVATIVEKVYARIRGKLTLHDVNCITSGEVAWRNRLRWARKSLALDGNLSTDSPRGVWAITNQGRKSLKMWRTA